MSRSAEEQALLDEKIAKIRAKNEKIIKKQQLIREEIELAKKHHAMVDVKASLTSLDDDMPTLYADKIEKPQRTRSEPKNFDNIDRRRMNSNLATFNSRNSSKDDSVWRAERNQIDRERIRRQKANSGWRREWDANKTISDDEFPSPANHINDKHSQKRENSRPSQFVAAEERKSELTALRPKQPRGRGLSVGHRPSEGRQIFDAKNDVAVQSRSRPQNSQPLPHASSGPDLREMIRAKNAVACGTRGEDRGVEKAPLVKKVSWDSEKELVDSPRISLTDDHLRIIKVKVANEAHNLAAAGQKRRVEITEKRGPISRPAGGCGSSTRFDEKTSLDIKDCVSKTAATPSMVQQFVVKDTIFAAPKSKVAAAGVVAHAPVVVVAKSALKRSSDADSANFFKSGDASVIAAAGEPKSILQNSAVLLTCTKSKNDTKNEDDDDDDDEWEDVSGEEWESVSDDE